MDHLTFPQTTERYIHIKRSKWAIFAHGPIQNMNVKAPPEGLEKVMASTLEKNVDDLVQMEDINEAMIVHNLRKRFKNDQIYVNSFSPPLQTARPLHKRLADEHRDYLN
jgi:myosin heavy subunit